MLDRQYTRMGIRLQVPGGYAVSSILACLWAIAPGAAQSTAPVLPAGPPNASARYVPAPEPADTGNLLVGAWMCPLWREGCRGGKEWHAIVPYPERQPLLGWYDEGSPEVTDWEITWAVNHGISFFVPCWYRQHGNLGQPVKPVLEHWVRDGLLRSRYRNSIKFAILWENSNAIACGMASERDLLDNVLPYWIGNFFHQPNYLVLDGKPVLFVYTISQLATELGGPDTAQAAIARMREACRNAGFAGLTIVGVHNGNPDDPLDLMKRIGLDDVSSYHWPTFAGNMPWPWGARPIMAAQEDCWRRLTKAASLPSILTVSMGWDDRPWGGKAGWRLTPEQFAELCGRAKTFLQARHAGGLADRMVLVDNWNEFGEGHYVAPHRQYGFGYLDAIRRVFSPAAKPHRDLVPEDVGLGPYDSLFRAAQTR